jgi:hypothetical protein
MAARSFPVFDILHRLGQHRGMTALMSALMAVFLAATTLGAADSPIPSPNPIHPDQNLLNPPPLGPSGIAAHYRLKTDGPAAATVVGTFSLALGPSEINDGRPCQWLLLDATKTGGGRFRVWILASEYPAPTLGAARKAIARYIVQKGESEPIEFVHRFTRQAVLPSLGGWEYLLPRDWPKNAPGSKDIFPPETSLLGHRYARETIDQSSPAVLPMRIKAIPLLPEVMVGVPSNTRTKGDARRYDDSDYELVRLTRENYLEMVASGMNCLRVDAEQVTWISDLPVFYWGVGGKELDFPECLYQSSYLGPELFLDEPAVGTRDHVLRPRLAKEADYRRRLTPQIAFDAFCQYYQEAIQGRAPNSLLQGLAQRSDVQLGGVQFRQANLFTWETMISTAAYQLSQDPQVPAAMVFEPPGRVGTRRTLPEFDMTYGCQIPVDDPKNLTAILFGFLRGAARLTDKDWGVSIYGGVDQADAPWFLTHAYDLGATRFFFWDNYRSACVPYRECLALARHLRAHVENNPRRQRQTLLRAAETAILLPPGYNLGHVHMGKGSLWGLGELNLERLNSKGIPYRRVMGHFFTEIENCLRQGTSFDLLCDLPALQPTGYREVIRIRDDGRIEVNQAGVLRMHPEARTPSRPSGTPPRLSTTISIAHGQVPLRITARAMVQETSAPVYYTLGTDTDGIYQNAVVAWELYGPGEEDYRFLTPARLKPQVSGGGGYYEVRADFQIDQPGSYRLRAATVDLAGRTTVTWTPVTATR